MIIVLTSGGVNWVGAGQLDPGSMHGYKIIQRIHDVRGLMDDPVDKYPNRPGTDPEVSAYILGHPIVESWLLHREDEVACELDGNQFEDKVILHIGFRCKGGFGRSVVLIEELKRRLEEDFERLGLRHTVFVKHLTMDLALDIKKHLGV